MKGRLQSCSTPRALLEGQLLGFSATRDGAEERPTPSHGGARETTWSSVSRARAVPASRLYRVSRSAAVAEGLGRTARYLQPDELMSGDSEILPSGFFRPLISALEPPQRGRAAPRAPRGAG